jgi:large subunit ribosomal protein L25
MEEILLQAIERNEQSGKFKENGFTPGVLYGDSVTAATSVKFDALALKKVIANHGSNAKVWIKLNDSKKFGIIKAIQKNPLTGNIIHVDVQIVSKDHELKLQIPIVFQGEDDLKQNLLQLHVNKSEITVLGKMDLMIDAIYVDVSEKKLGDTITVNDFNLDKQLKINEKEDVIYATIINLKIAEEPVEPETKPVTKT